MILRCTIQIHFVIWEDTVFQLRSKMQWRRASLALKQRGKRIYKVLAILVSIDSFLFLAICNSLVVFNEKSGGKIFGSPLPPPSITVPYFVTVF